MTHGSIPPGWYDDGQGAQRWWDGNGWSEQTRPSQASTGAAEPSAPASSPSDATTVRPPSAGFPQPGQPAYGQPAYGQQPGLPGPGGLPPGGQSGWQSPYGAGPGGPGGGGGGGGTGKGLLIAIIGGVVALLVAVGVVLVLTLGGDDGDGDNDNSSDSGGGEDAPEADGGPTATVEEFFEGTVAADCGVLDLFSNRYLSTDAVGRQAAIEDLRTECEAAGDGFATTDVQGCELEVTGEEVDGETATVDYAVTACDDETDNDTGTFAVVLEDGEWRIDGDA